MLSLTGGAVSVATAPVPLGACLAGCPVPARGSPLGPAVSGEATGWLPFCTAAGA